MIWWFNKPDTYKQLARCSNCKDSFFINIKKGESSEGQNAQCQNCAYTGQTILLPCNFGFKALFLKKTFCGFCGKELNNPRGCAQKINMKNGERQYFCDEYCLNRDFKVKR